MEQGHHDWPQTFITPVTQEESTPCQPEQLTALHVLGSPEELRVDPQHG